MVLCKKVNFLTLHHFIKCKHLVSPHLSVFECLCIPNWNCLNHNCKVFITLHLAQYVEQNGPHTPCSHAKKLKNGTKGKLDKCMLRNLRCVLQSYLEPILLQVYMPLNLRSNCLLLIAIELGQRVVQDLRIHGHVMLWAFLPSKWMSRFI